jgi:deoxyribodipyrimidine photolyase-related protein
MSEPTDIKTLRLILGDQLNMNHSWYKECNPNVTYVLMELRSETDYAKHHIQKVVGFFAAMRRFADGLRRAGHQVIYLALNDSENQQSFESNLRRLISECGFTRFEYQFPDEYRVDQHLKSFTVALQIPTAACDSEHFFTSSNDLDRSVCGKKTYLMETFYRKMRSQHGILMDGDQPLTGQWNYDQDNRKKIPKGT